MRNLPMTLAACMATALLASPAAWSADAMKGDMKKPGDTKKSGDMKSADMKMSGTYTNSTDIKWGDAPPVFPKGAKMAVLEGDPGKQGPFVARLMMPANYKIAPHWHTADEDLTIISGNFYLAEGDKMDTKGAHEVKAGGFHHLPGKTHHFAYTKSAAVVQINGMGPFDMTYIDAKDDPSKMAAAPAKDEMKKGAAKKM